MGNIKIVTIGGGTGTYPVLNGLKNCSDEITAVVTMADDGGSSGRLRDDFGHLPPGDVRRCLTALSADQEISNILTALFEYRFDRGYGLNGHSFGNLFLTALTELTGSVELAVMEASRLLNIRGRVLPVTTDDVRLSATLVDGTLIRGERHIDVRRVKPELPIRQVFLSPEAVAYPPVLDAIREAELLVIGPGDLYTSIIPNLLVRGVPEAIRECKGARVYVCNLMTKYGETSGFSASDFISEISRYLGGTLSIDCMIVNSAHIKKSSLSKYVQENSTPVVCDLETCLEFVPRVLQGDFVAEGSPLRHDSLKLADALMGLIDTKHSNESSEHNGVVAAID